MGDRLQQNLCLGQGLKDEGRTLLMMISRALFFFHSARQEKIYLGLPSTVVQVLNFTIPGGIIFTLKSSWIYMIIMTISSRWQ